MSIMFKESPTSHDGVKFIMPTIPKPSHWPTRNVDKKFDVRLRRTKERPFGDADLFVTVAKPQRCRARREGMVTRSKTMAIQAADRRSKDGSGTQRKFCSRTYSLNQLLSELAGQKRVPQARRRRRLIRGPVWTTCAVA